MSSSTNDPRTPTRTETIGATLVWALVLVVVTSILSFFLFGSVYGVAFGNPSTPPAPTNGVTSVNLYQTISFSPWQGHDQYYPANFSVPVNVPVNFVIASYDNGSNNLPDLQAYSVTGTNSGSEIVKGGQPGTPQGAVTSLTPGDTAHTFTIDDAAAGINLNVIVPPTANISYPVLVSFQVTFTQTGTFTWHCMAPCDPYSMATPGYMSGQITVT